MLFDLDVQWLLCFKYLAGSVPWKIHRQWFHLTVLQAYAKQEANDKRPGIDRSRILHVSTLGQVSLVSSLALCYREMLTWGSFHKVILATYG